MRKQITVRLDETIIEELRQVARKRAHLQKTQVDWLDVLEDAGRRIVQRELAENTRP